MPVGLVADRLAAWPGWLCRAYRPDSRMPLHLSVILAELVDQMLLELIVGRLVAGLLIVELFLQIVGRFFVALLLGFVDLLFQRLLFGLLLSDLIFEDCFSASALACC